LPRTVKVTAYDFAVVDVFALNLADRETVPVLHFTVLANPVMVGLDDQPQVLALRTEALKLTEPPEALTVLVAAPAWATTRPLRQSATLAILTTILRFIVTSKNGLLHGSHGEKVEGVAPK
jgi:hypothetical protein